MAKRAIVAGMKVGFIGLGTMGASMATNLQRGGYDLVVNDIRPDAGAAHLAAGAEWADSARDVIGDQVIHVGPIGSGSVAKLVHNCAGYMIQCALAEAFTLGVKAGVEPLALWQAVRQGAVGRSRTFDRLPDHFLSGKFDPPDFALRLAHKDVSF